MRITEEVNWSLCCTLWFPYFGTLRRQKSPQPHHSAAQLGNSNSFLPAFWPVSEINLGLSPRQTLFILPLSPAFSWHGSTAPWSVDCQHNSRVCKTKGSPIASLSEETSYRDVEETSYRGDLAESPHSSKYRKGNVVSLTFPGS